MKKLEMDRLIDDFEREHGCLPLQIEISRRDFRELQDDSPNGNELRPPLLRMVICLPDGESPRLCATA